MLQESAGLHWLADIARRSGWPNADSLVIAAGTPLCEEWSQVAEHCGMSLDALAQEIAESLHLPCARFESRDPRAQKFVPEKIARRFGVVPLRESDRQIVVACADPLNDEVERGVAFAAGRMPLFEVASPQAIEAEIQRTYAAPVSTAALRAGGAANAEDALTLVRTTSVELADDESDAAPVVKLVNIILRNAMHERASDIHIEPGAGNGTVRFRVDGVMRVHMRMPMAALNRVIARIKIMGALDIADRLRPQDGRATFAVDQTDVDLRISTVPTRESEKCVIRLLRGGADDRLADLKLSDRDVRAIRALIANRNGIVVVTGPTGSGKTTTLYAAIRELNNGETNISTVEDPIEYDLAGITQMQVENKREFTFAAALRAIMRQDPDVILVGEVRDLETATIAVQASMTGHLVLTTLHTNDAAGAVARLVDIGVERPAIAATLRGVVAQRLVRKICPHCAEKVEALHDDERRLAQVYGIPPVVRAVGCDRCGKSGYLGRMAVVEILTLNPQLQEAISKGVPANEIQRLAVQTGMLSLRVSALQRVADGETTLQEVERVVGETTEGVAVVAAPVVQSNGRPSGPRVLLVDDDTVCRKVAKRLLEEGGYDVIEAVNGEDALAQLEIDDHIALTVLDLGLPTIQGDEVLRRMRVSPVTASMPVLVLTGSPDPDLEVRLMDEGADDYIRKPIEAKRFVTRVKAALRRAAA